ncbi:MAG: cyclic nucleotide-binding domain-containing protein [Bacteroidetes bacterium]|nr:cyclic nucleotide-binding domain-containing protein [Bacteroidota bacterium]
MAGLIFSISQLLRQELLEHGKAIKLVEWYALEKEFLENHVYFTDAAYALRNKGKLNNLEEIKALLRESSGNHGLIDMTDMNAQILGEDRKHLVSLLGRTSLFKSADLKLLEHIAKVVDRIHLKENEPLFKKGDAGESMYIIESGTLRVHDGSIIFAVLKQGEYFGEASIIDNSPRTASVSAASDAIILRIGEKDFFSLLGSHPSMNRMLMKELINRLRNQNNAVVDEYKSREQKLTELVELRTRQIVEEKKNVEQKSRELELALKELQETQRLLIHHEKMASLGQLTSGIAHELMNPLNFVNNFSAVSLELLQEVSNLTTDEEAKELCTDLIGNLERISMHGIRASEIVKSMSEHSTNYGKEREEVNINDLIEDALKASKTTWDADYPNEKIAITLDLNAKEFKTKVVYVDILRIVINVLRNARSAVHDQYLIDPTSQGEINISTENNNNSIQIFIRDNGVGISNDIVEKIFLPFFTTRPTGKGVGLGLSISHQIASAYGGNLDYVPSEKGACFVVSIPLEV